MIPVHFTLLAGCSNSGSIPKPYHKPKFAEPKTFVFHCALGWRSLLAAKFAQEMGLDARGLRGGFSEWKKGGKPVSAKPGKSA